MADDRNETQAEVHGEGLLDVNDSVAFSLINDLLRTKKVFIKAVNTILS